MLEELIADLVAATVDVNGEPVAGTPLAELREYQPSAHLPCRLLLPFGRQRAIDRIAFDWGKTGPAAAQLQVTDLLLYTAIAEGEGLIEAAEPLVKYRDSYAAMVIALRQTLESCYQVQEVTLNSGPFQFGTDWFWAVEAVWTVNVLME